MVQDASGKILRDGADVSPGDRVTVTLGQGGFRATVDAPKKRRGRPPKSEAATPKTEMEAKT